MLCQQPAALVQSGTGDTPQHGNEEQRKGGIQLIPAIFAIRVARNRSQETYLDLKKGKRFIEDSSVKAAMRSNSSILKKKYLIH